MIYLAKIFLDFEIFLNKYIFFVSMENYYSCTLYNNRRTCRVLAGNVAVEELPFPILTSYDAL